jgi:hypothetical protein
MISYLEHLDESNRQIEVGVVAKHQAHAKEDANGDNGAEVDSSRHWHLLSRVEFGGESSHELGHGGSKDQMPCCQ